MNFANRKFLINLFKIYFLKNYKGKKYLNIYRDVLPKFFYLSIYVCLIYFLLRKILKFFFQNMKLFITGGTGYIGREFINNHIHKIQLIYLVSRKKTNFKNKKIKVLYGSISDNWQKEMKNSDALIHFAAAGVKNKNISYKDAYKFNVIDSMKLFQNAFKYNLKIGSS